jgi:hypothetical protein
MTAAEGSFLGFAPQVSKGVANTTDADFKYLLFRQGQASSQSIIVPLDAEVGGGALMRSVAKMGVSGAGAVDFVPRPASLGMMLKAATGWVKSYKNLVTMITDHAADNTKYGCQIETATGTTDVGGAGAGSYKTIVTAAGMVTTTVTTAVANSDTPTLYMAKVRADVAANAVIAAMFDVGTTPGATLVLTRKTPVANDATLNIELFAAGSTATGPDNVATSANTQAGLLISNQPASAVKMLVAGSGGVAGNVVLNAGLADADTIALTGVIMYPTLKTFKTITKIEMPPTPTGSTTTTITLKDGASNTCLTAQTLDDVRTTVSSGFTNPSPASVVKVIMVSDQHVYGVCVRLWGTNASDQVIDETVYVYPYEMVLGAVDIAEIHTITYPDDAGGEKRVRLYWHDGSYSHEFTLSQFDNFDAPWFTGRFSPGGAWGEQYVDSRFNTLGLEFRAANYLNGALGFIGITPSKVASTNSWNALDYVDSGPQFLAPLADIQLPSGTTLCVLQGAFAAAMQIPLDEQYCVGSYYPESLDLVARQFSINMVVKVTDETLYNQMQYDPNFSSGASAWVAEIFRNANFKLEFVSDQDAAVVKPSGSSADYNPYKLNINGNMLTGDDANVLWSVAPINLKAQRQVLMNISGMFTASPVSASDPIKFTLVNREVSY